VPKLNNERLKTKHYEDLINKHQQKIEDLRRKQSKFPDRNYEDKINYHTEMQRYYYHKSRDSIAIAEDFIIEPTVNIEMLNFYLENLFPTDNAYVSIMINDGLSIRRRMMELETAKRKLPHILSFDNNTYISPVNYSHRRTLKNEDGKEYVLTGSKKDLIISSAAIIIDLDYRDTELYYGMMAEELYDEIRAAGKFDVLGEPSFVVVSSQGRGMQLVYLLDELYKTYFNRDRIVRYEQTVRRLIVHFNEYGSDVQCCDCGHLFRLPCSFNIKTGTYSYILNWEELRDDDYEISRYSFADLEQCSKEITTGIIEETIDGDEPESEQQPEQQPEQPVRQSVPETRKHRTASEIQRTEAKETSRNTIKTVALNRCADLKRLIKLRENRIEGHRDTFLYIYGATFIGLCDNTDVVLNELVAINSTFDKPLPENELKNIVKGITKKHYWFTDKHIREKLKITQDEITKLKTIGHNLTEDELRERSKEKKRLTRLAKGMMTAEQRAARNEEVRSLSENGLTNKQLMERFKLSRRTIQRIINAPETMV